MAELWKTERTVITVQHTESVHHTNGHVGAWGDWPLSERGMEQAREVGKWLRTEGVNSDYTMLVSDLKRASMTAEGINETLGLTPVYRPVIREVNAGEGNGKPWEWFAEHRNPPKDEFDPDYRPFPDGESDRDVWTRLQPFYEEITTKTEGNLLIVSHGTALSFLQAMLLGMTLEDRGRVRFRGKAGSVSRFGINKDGSVTVYYLNRTVW